MDLEEKDPNVPVGMTQTGDDEYPQLTLLSAPYGEHNSQLYIGIKKATKLQRFEEGHYLQCNMRDFKTGMYALIPQGTMIFLTAPGDCYPYSVLLSSKPFPSGVYAEPDRIGQLRHQMERHPLTAPLVKVLQDYIERLK